MSRRLERNRECDLRAASQVVRGDRGSSMSARDRFDDREPEADTRAPRSSRIRATEALEGMRQKVQGEALPLVGHRNYESVALEPRIDVDSAGAVAKRVFDEISHCLLEPHAICDENHTLGRRDLERTPGVSCSWVMAARHRIKQRAHVVALEAKEKPPFVGARDDEEILCELYEALDLLAGRAESRLELVRRTGTAQRELQFRPEGGQGRS